MKLFASEVCNHKNCQSSSMKFTMCKDYKYDVSAYIWTREWKKKRHFWKNVFVWIRCVCVSDCVNACSTSCFASEFKHIQSIVNVKTKYKQHIIQSFGKGEFQSWKSYILNALLSKNVLLLLAAFGIIVRFLLQKRWFLDQLVQCYAYIIIRDVWMLRHPSRSLHLQQTI